MFKKLEKQPPEVFYKKNYSENFCNIHRKSPVLESLCFFRTLETKKVVLLKTYRKSDLFFSLEETLIIEFPG